MEGLLIYIGKTVVCSGVFYLIYRLLLDRKAPVRFCRIYLLMSVLLSCIIPVAKIPVLPGEVIKVQAVSEAPSFNIIEYETDFAAVEIQETAPTTIPYHTIIYLTITLLALSLLIFQLLKINRYKRGAVEERTSIYTLFLNACVKSPFSFFRNIFMHPRIDGIEKEQIIYHELSHIRHRHSAELMFIEIFKTFFWFNPFIWLMRTSLVEVHEYEADRDVIRAGYDPDAYSILVFRQLFGCNPDMASGLSNAKTLKRFIMMKKLTNKSRHLALRVGGAVLTMGVLLVVFSFTKKATEYIYTEEVPYATEGSVEHDKRDKIIEVSQKNSPKASLVTVSKKSDSNSNLWIKGTGNVEESVYIIIDGKVSNQEALKSLEASEIENLSIYKAGNQATVEFLEKMGLDVKKSAIALDTIAGKEELAIAEPQKDDEPFLRVEQMPKFQGGDLNSFRVWVQSRLVYPKTAWENGIQGKVTLSFIIEADGTLSNIRVMQSPDKSLSDETTRVLKESPKWEPGKQRGQNVRVKYTIPVDFKITGNDPKPADDGKLHVQEDRPGSIASSISNDGKLNIVEDKPMSDEPFLSVDEMPKFEGGDLNKFRQWVQARLVYPEEAVKNGIQGRLTVGFVIEADGSVSRVEILQSPDKLLSDEVIRVLKLSPKWTPGKQRGVNVKVKYTLPLDFTIPKADKPEDVSKTKEGKRLGEQTVVTTIRTDEGGVLNEVEKYEVTMIGPDLQKHEVQMSKLPERPLSEESIISYINGAHVADPVIIIDGKESSLDGLDPSAIDNITIFKSPKKEILDIFGITRNANNGIIVIETKAYKESLQKEEPFLTVEQMPTFQDGDINKFTRWLMSNLVYPPTLTESTVVGRVVAKFVIEKDGSIGDIEVTQSPAKEWSNEVVRVLKSSPKWEPGKQGGQDIRVGFTVPIDITVK